MSLADKRENLMLHWPCSGAPESLQSYLHSRLPAAYQQVEYIEALNSAYLDTGYIANRSLTRIQIEMMPLDAADSAFFGNRGDYWCFYNIGQNYWYPRSACEIKTGPAMEINKKILVDWNKGIFEAWQGLHYEKGVRTGGALDTDTMYLFNFHQIDGRRSYARIYWCKIWDNDIKVRDYIPAKRISDNIVGLYDLANNTFITNAGPGSLVAGPALNFTPFSTFNTIEWDISGHGYHGTINSNSYNLVQTDSKRYNNSYHITSHHINSAANTFNWFNFDNCTISAWMKGTQKAGGYTGSIGIQHEANSGHKYLVLSNAFGGNLICQYTDGGYKYVTSNFLIDDGIWHHCVLVQTNSTEIKLYVDSVERLNTTINWNNIPQYSDQHFSVGWDEPGSNEQYVGNISDVRFYNVALSVSEIQELYNMGKVN